MDIREIEQIWQAVLRRYYPSVIVRETRSIPEEDDCPFLGVYMLPDGKRAEFVQLSIDELWKVEEQEGLPPVNLLHHTVSQTREYFPHIWRDAQSEKRASSTVKRSLSSPVKSPVRKPAKAKARSVEKIAART